MSLLVFALAVVGAMSGAFVFMLHVQGDPLNDAQAYYWAGGRLNAGLPLYPPDQSVSTPLGYPYPPMIAILWRPLALLPWPVAAAVWEVVVVAAFLATVWWLGPRRKATWLAMGVLALPIGWCVAIGQVQVILTLFSVIGTPWSVALATNIKLFPALLALWWFGRRDWRRLGQYIAWMAGLALVQLILAPQASLDYLSLHQPAPGGCPRRDQQHLAVRGLADPLGCPRGARRADRHPARPVTLRMGGGSHARGAREPAPARVPVHGAARRDREPGTPARRRMIRL